jgi:MFS family permease
MSPSKEDCKAQCEHIEMMANNGSTNMYTTHEEEKDLTLWQAIKTFPRIILFSLAACSAGMTFGYDIVINGAGIAMPSFLLYFGAMTPAHTLYLPSIWASLFSAMSALLQAFGGIAVAPLSDRYGRKIAILVSCVISAVGVALYYSATTRGMILAGKMVNGFAIGGILSSATAWASEISPMCLRGPIQSGIVLFTVLMQAMALVVIRQHIAIITPNGFRDVFAIQWLFCGLTFVLFILVPESPTWLILEGRHEQAKKAINRLYGSKNNPEAWYESIASKIRQEAAQENVSGIGGFLDLYRGSNLKRTMTVHLLFFGIGLAGSSFLAQSIYFLLTAGLPAIHTFDVSIGGFCLAFFTIIASWVYLEKVGRRSLWLVGCLVNVVVMAIIGSLYWAPGKGALWTIAILM